MLVYVGYKPNTEERSRNQCYREKMLSITCSQYERL